MCGHVEPVVDGGRAVVFVGESKTNSGHTLCFIVSLRARFWMRAGTGYQMMDERVIILISKHVKHFPRGFQGSLCLH